MGNSNLPDGLFLVGARVLADCGMLEVRGGSMEPCIPDGSKVRVDTNFRDGFSMGDIVVFQSGGVLKVHRYLFRRSRGRLVTMGDAAWDVDPSVPLESVIGLVSGYEKRGRLIAPKVVRGFIRAIINLSRAVCYRLYNEFLR